MKDVETIGGACCGSTFKARCVESMRKVDTDCDATADAGSLFVGENTRQMTCGG